MKDQWTGKIGDKDPVDVCEIGTLPRPTGTVMPVRSLSLSCTRLLTLAAFSFGVSFVVRRLLGVLAMIDDDATDWKVQQVVM